MKAIRWFLLFAAVAAVTIGGIVWINREAFKTLWTNRGTISEGSEFVPQTFSMAGLAGFSAAHPEFVAIVNLPLNDSLPYLGIHDTIPRVAASLEWWPLAVSLESAGLFERPISRTTAGTFSPGRIRQTSDEDKALDALFCEACTPSAGDLFALAVAGNQQAGDMLKAAAAAADPFFSQRFESNGFEAPVSFWSAYARHMLGRPGLPDLHTMEPALRDSVQKAVEAAGLPDFKSEKAFYQSLPKAAPRAAATLVRRIARGEVLGPEADARILTRMEAATAHNQERDEFRRLAAAYHNRLGQLGGMEFSVSAYDSTAWVNVVLFDNLPVNLWLHMSSNHMNQDFQQRLTWDPGLRARLRDSAAVYQRL